MRLVTASFLLLAFAFSSAAEPRITWGPSTISTSVYPGTSLILHAQFTSSVALTNADIRVVPALSSFVHVVPSSFQTIQPSIPQSVSLQISIPKGTPAGTLQGALQLRDGNTLAQPLPINLTIQAPNAFTIPLGPTAPSPDRIGAISPSSQNNYVTDEVDIFFKPGTPLSTIQQLVQSVGGAFLGSVPELRMYQIALPVSGFDNLGLIIQTLESNPAVEAAIRHLFSTLNLFPTDPGMVPPYAPANLINLPSAWDITRGSNSVRIGVIDSQFDLSSIDLNANLAGFIVGPPPLTVSHGTEVASIIGAGANNGVGIAGVMWNASMYLYGASSFTNPMTLDAVYVMSYAVAAISQQVRVINYSAGVSCQTKTPGAMGYCTNQDLASLDDEDKMFRQLIALGQQSGDITWVFAIADHPLPADDLLFCSPARLSKSFSNVISVGAVDDSKKLASFSYFGPGLTIYAPGIGIYADLPGGSTTAAQGTSFAAPLVTGVVGLMLSQNSKLTSSQIKSLIISTAHHTSNYDPNGNEILLLDAHAAVQAATSSPSQYTATDLGTLGGASGTSAHGIDDAGQVVGGSWTGQYGGGGATCGNGQCPIGHAFLWTAGTMIDLGLPPNAFGIDSTAYSINNSGQVVGTYGYPAYFGGSLFYSGGVTTDPMNGLPSAVQGINNLGQFVGTVSTTGAEFAPYHAFIKTGATITDLGTFGGSSSTAFAVNDSGQVVGQATFGDGSSHAFLFNGTLPLQDLGTLGGTSSLATGINAGGQVVGWANTGSGTQHAFLYITFPMTDLGTLGGNSSQADAINKNGAVVGWANTAAGDQHAFILSGAGMKDLNTMVSLPMGVMLVEATGINDGGQIVANGSDGRAYLLTPNI